SGHTPPPTSPPPPQNQNPFPHVRARLFPSAQPTPSRPPTALEIPPIPPSYHKQIPSPHAPQTPASPQFYDIPPASRMPSLPTTQTPSTPALRAPCRKCHDAPKATHSPKRSDTTPLPEHHPHPLQTSHLFLPPTPST